MFERGGVEGRQRTMNVRARRGAVALTAALVVTLLAAVPAPAGAALTDNGCRLLPPLNTAAPIGKAPCPGVRPGAVIRSNAGSCTMNYLFHGSDGRRYIGTAGHCVIEAPPTGGDFPEQRWTGGDGPLAMDAAGKRIGRFSYAVLRDSEEADFALVRLDPGVGASAQMCHFGGPNGLSGATTRGATLLNHFGAGVAIGGLLPARSALALGMPSPRHVYANGVVLPGDSGSAINSSDGRAVGIVVTTGVHVGRGGSGGLDAGLVGIVRLGPMLSRAAGFTGTTYALQTAPRR